MLLELFKAKALPIGTKKKNKDGSWRVKTGRGWKYYPKGKLPAKYKTKKKVTKKKPVKKIIKPTAEWDGKGVPSKAQVISMLGKTFETYKEESEKRDATKKLIGRLSWKTLQNYSYDKLFNLEGKLSALTISDLNSAGFHIREVVRGLLNLKVLYKKGVSKPEIYKLDPVKNGVLVSMRWYTKNAVWGKLPAMLVGYDKLVPTIKAYTKTTDYNKNKLVNMLLKDVKSSWYYKEWQKNGGDPVLTKSMKEFKKATGLNIESTAGYSKGQVELKPVYIKKLAKVFKTIQKEINMKNYQPPDGEELTVRVERAGKKFVGTYVERFHSINISPTYAGSITHEMGHYFWERSKPMQREFMDWIVSSGLKDKIGKNTNPLRLEEAKAIGVDGAFTVGVQGIDKFVDTMSDIISLRKVAKKVDSESLKEVAHTLLYIYKEHFVKNNFKKDAYVQDKKPFSRVLELNEADTKKFAEAVCAKYPELVLSPEEFAIHLKNVQKGKGVEAFNRITNDVIKNQIDYLITWGPMLNAPSESQYIKEAGYYRKPTEIFARTFRNYIAWKGGQPFFKSSYDQGQYFRVNNIDSKSTPYGWDFPEVSPDPAMMKKGLGKILKKYIGNKVIKSLIFKVEPLEKAKYVKRWKGKNGKWQYEYNQNKTIKSILDMFGKPITLHDKLRAYKENGLVKLKQLKEQSKQYESKVKNYIDKTTRDARVIMFENTKHKDIKYLVHPSSREAGKWQLSAFDVKGAPLDHTTFDTKKEAMHAAIGYGQGARGNLNYGISNMLKSRLVIMLKAKALPIGTIRTHGGVKKKKMANGKWIPIKKDKTSKLEQAIKEGDKWVKDNSRGGTYEASVIIDSNGNRLFAKRGGKDYVDFTYEQDVLKKEKIGAMIHNHPNSSSFSEADITLALYFRIPNMRVISEKYIYNLKISPFELGLMDDYGEKQLEEIGHYYFDITEKVRHDFNSRIQEGKMTVPEAEALHNHAVMVELAKERGWEYERKRTK